MESTEHTDVLIIGAGQSGLALGYQLPAIRLAITIVK
jgi:cation diffusion facilitator CzcD-associated flavoprotein CzcO